MSKLYIVLFLIVAIYLLYKMKTKKPKEQINRNQGRDFSDIATEFLFYELINQKPISLPSVNPMRQHINRHTYMQPQREQQQRQSSHLDGQQARSLSSIKNKTKTKRKQWGVRVRNKIARSQDWRCAVCKELLPEMFHLDHITPLCNRGQDEINNLQAICANCHSSKTNDEGIRFGF